MLQDPHIEGNVAIEMIIRLNELELEALKSIVDCPCKWTANAVHNRARIAIDEIVSKYVAKALENGWDIPQNKLDIVKAYNEKFEILQKSQAPSVET